MPRITLVATVVLISILISCSKNNPVTPTPTPVSTVDTNIVLITGSVGYNFVDTIQIQGTITGVYNNEIIKECGHFVSYSSKITDSKVDSTVKTGIGLYGNINSGFNLPLGDTTYYITAYAKTVSNKIYYGLTVAYKAPKFNSQLSLNLLAYYPLNGNAGDSSGHNLNGTVSGATLTNDRFGLANKAYNFGNAKSIYVSNFTMNVNNFTLSFWFKQNTNNSSSQRIVTHHWDGGGTGSFSSAIVGNTISGNFKSSLNADNGFIIPFNQTANTWYFYTISYDGSTMKCFINGVLQWQNAYSGGMKTSTDILYFGGDTLYPFLGDVDDIRIYGRALRVSEIKYLNAN